LLSRKAGSALLSTAFEKTPATNEDSVDERFVSTSLFVLGLTAVMDIWGTRSGCHRVL
jgi:hypothetical protein